MTECDIEIHPDLEAGHNHHRSNGMHHQVAKDVEKDRANLYGTYDFDNGAVDAAAAAVEHPQSQSEASARHGALFIHEMKLIVRKKEVAIAKSVAASFTDKETELGGLDRTLFAQRLELEVRMLKNLPHALLFLCSFLLFVYLQHVEHNPVSFANTHSSIRNSFDLEQGLYGVNSLPELVLYLEGVAQSTNKLDPLDPYHWCAEQDASPLASSIPERINCRRDAVTGFDEHYEGVTSATKQRSRMIDKVDKLFRIVSPEAYRRLSGSAAYANGSRKKTSNSSKQSAGVNLPRARRIELALPVPPSLNELRRFGNRTVSASTTAGVVGFALNGVLLIGQHHHRGKLAMTSWHFDDCGGHVDTNGWYHYHFPPSCFLRSLDVAGPPTSQWWFDPDADQFWPRRSLPSPVLGYALDGLPIYGPYDYTGELVNSSKLDECNGHAHVGPAGKLEYHYHWTAMTPFLPSCFVGSPIHLNMSHFAVGEPCPSHGNSIVAAVFDTSALVGAQVLHTSSCPDHKYFQNAVHVDNVSHFVAGCTSQTTSKRRALACAGCKGCGSREGCNAGCKASAAGDNCSGDCDAKGTACTGGCTARSEGCSGVCSAGGIGCSAGCTAGDKGCTSGCVSNERCSGGCSAGNGGCSGGCHANGKGRIGGCSADITSCSGGCYGDCSASSTGCSGGCDACSIVDIFNPCAAAFDGCVAQPPAPESYTRFHPFTMVTASVLPPVIWQTRWCEEQCDSQFASDFNHQKFNPVYRMPLNAPRREPLVRCRSKDLCDKSHLGYRPVMVDGEPRYSVFLSEALIDPIKTYDWFDDLTDKITVGLLVYTPGFEGLSLLKICFQITDTGRVRPYFLLKTHKVLADTDQFYPWVVMTFVFLILCVVRVVDTVYHIRHTKKYRPDNAIILLKFDAVHSSCFFVYSLVSLYRRIFMSSTLDDIVPLLDVYYGVSNIQDKTQIEDLLERYFKVFQDFAARDNEEDLLKLIAYFMILVSFGRLILYMSVHPRIAIISTTIASAADNMLHFFLAFGFIFVTLAWLALWSFGPDKVLFSTFGESVNTCFRMMLGGFEFEESWKESPLQRVWYVCFAFLVYFLSVNVFLAIIVEAFLEVKKSIQVEYVTERSVVADVCGLLFREVVGRTCGWPTQQELARHLFYTRHFAAPVTSQELVGSVIFTFKDSDQAKSLMDYYFSILGRVILSPKGREFVTSVAESHEIEDCMLKVFNYTEQELDQLKKNVVKIQQAWRAKRQYAHNVANLGDGSERSASQSVPERKNSQPSVHSVEKK